MYSSFITMKTLIFILAATFALSVHAAPLEDFGCNSRYEIEYQERDRLRQKLHDIEIDVMNYQADRDINDLRRRVRQSDRAILFGEPNLNTSY